MPGWVKWPINYAAKYCIEFALNVISKEKSYLQRNPKEQSVREVKCLAH